jgi:hypothetical protein
MRARWGAALAVLLALLASPTAALAQSAGFGQNVTLTSSAPISPPLAASTTSRLARLACA